MKKIIVLSFITLDGVMQAPDGLEEDTRAASVLEGGQFLTLTSYLAI